MKIIKIIGPGCDKCKRMFELTKETVESLGIEHELEKITDIQEFINYGVMITPALVVDDVVKVSGRVPSEEEIKEMLS